VEEPKEGAMAREERSATLAMTRCGHTGLGLENKLEPREPARARSGSARLGVAREPRASRAEPAFWARSRSEPSRAGSRAVSNFLICRIMMDID
jgi:hypothetical protein